MDTTLLDNYCYKWDTAPLFDVECVCSPDNIIICTSIQKI